MKKLVKIVLVLCVLMQFYSVACDLKKEKIEEGIRVEKEKDDLEKNKNNSKIEALDKKEEKVEKKDITKDVLYKNDRFKFSMIYPGFLEVEEDGFNNEGKTVLDKTGKTKLVMFGENNLNEKTAKERLDDDLKYVGKPEFKRVDKNEYTISWKSGSKIYYKMVRVGKGSVVGFLIEYQSNEKEKYDNIISNLCKNLKVSNLSEVY
ncbi:MAG: hypothetical protein ACRC30_04130 [Clostridium sp.]